MRESWQVISENIPSQAKANELLSRLFNIARPDAAYSEPVTQGEYSLVTASEVSIGLGFGFGGGVGMGAANGSGESAESAARSEGDTGFGSGGGGGGTAMARPVAAIEIGPNGVRVEPIVDPTKISLAFFTMLGSMAFMVVRMRRAAAKK